MAPETIVGNPSTTKVDMWALGVMLYELFENVLPFVGDTPFLT
jgi:serine/threonine protein kinase